MKTNTPEEERWLAKIDMIQAQICNHPDAEKLRTKYELLCAYEENADLRKQLRARDLAIATLLEQLDSTRRQLYAAQRDAHVSKATDDFLNGVEQDRLDRQAESDYAHSDGAHQ